MSCHQCVHTLSGNTRSTNGGFEALGKLAHQRILLARIFDAKTEFHTSRVHRSQLARHKLLAVTTRRSPTRRIMSTVRKVLADSFRPLHHLSVGNGSLPPGDETKAYESVHTSPNDFWCYLVPRRRRRDQLICSAREAKLLTIQEIHQRNTG